MSPQQKQSFQRTGRLFKRFFDFRKWSDFDRLKGSTIYLLQGFQRLFIPQKKRTTQSFDDVLRKHQLTEDELTIQKKALLRLSILMLCIAAVFFIYLIYCFIYAHYRAVLINLVMIMIAIALAFRYHFWYFQLKRRQLGCGLITWFKEGLWGQKR